VKPEDDIEKDQLIRVGKKDFIAGKAQKRQNFVQSKRKRLRNAQEVDLLVALVTNRSVSSKTRRLTAANRVFNESRDFPTTQSRAEVLITDQQRNRN
jgi:hypothetical protein